MLPMPPRRYRTPLIVLGVVLLHGLGLWGLQSGLLQRVSAAVQELVVPVAVITAPPLPSPSPPKPLPPVMPSKATPAVPSPPVALAPNPRPPDAPQALPQAMADATASANAATGQAQPPAAVAVPWSPPAAAPAPPKVEWPSSSADYLHNPKPRYPNISERRGEQGVVLLSVLVGADGHAREVSVKASSGYERLDAAAREAVLGWTFVPGKRNGAAVEMSVDVPIRFKPSE